MVSQNQRHTVSIREAEAACEPSRCWEDSSLLSSCGYCLRDWYLTHDMVVRLNKFSFIDSSFILYLGANRDYFPEVWFRVPTWCCGGCWKHARRQPCCSLRYFSFLERRQERRAKRLHGGEKVRSLAPKQCFITSYTTFSLYNVFLL